ncbi:6-phospho-3-hexuloisomerase [Fructilactobacillus myrtifloralis]|uniref:6-phospho-3-hexuloisomerase n=1 Tax=Fructilactobacillus myrtifloralis TaxID=2940301 RepID=A0ABY5BPR3_9LACO|nr:6-phospho-3-hexuloisomerase [Fructilactobacillus myrtifloralis]USS85042.1 6-phospho-3-hexuloisomerase [Fructilactobacillus myrtifloralis]
MWHTILSELAQQDVPIEATELTLLNQAPRIFVYGGGRSGLALRGLAMRLMQLGKTAYVVGETTTPAIQAGDLLLVASASGTTTGTVNIATTAHQVGAQLWLLSTTNDSPLAKLADVVTILPGKSKDRVGSEQASIQPMGSLFEQSVWLFGDALTLAYMDFAGISEAEMRKRHANLE